jgi:hypothetical protein
VLEFKISDVAPGVWGRHERVEKLRASRKRPPPKENDRSLERPSTTTSSSTCLIYSPDAFLRRGRLAFFAAVRCFFAAISIGTMSGVPLPSYGLGCLYVNR